MCVSSFTSVWYFVVLVHQDFEKLQEYFKANYKVELTEKEMSAKGWNWGSARFGGKVSERSYCIHGYLRVITYL